MKNLPAIAVVLVAVPLLIPLATATTVTGNAMCRAANIAYRLDTPSARNFLANP